MTKELQKKVDRSIRLIQAAGDAAKAHNQPLEICYSGGKDSDVILELAKMSGVEYRAIYKNTTIDPPGTVKHAREMGAEVVMPKKTFFQLVAEAGFPNRNARFCCKELKEYKILDKMVMGIRKSESVKRDQNYEEPTKCIIYGSKENCAEATYPILYWTDKDVADFISERGIKCHPLYYDEQGRFHVERRLGCMCCPLAYKKKRIAYFKRYPGMVRAYIKAGQKYFDSHPDAKIPNTYDNVYDYFVRSVFYENQAKWEQSRVGLFEPIDSKQFLEEYFGIQL